MTYTSDADDEALTDRAWTAVCRLTDLTPERGAAALVEGRQIALFLLHDGSLHAVDHRDPFTGSNVIARGIVGTRRIDDEDRPTVASPLHKQVFDLRTGASFDDPQRSLAVHQVRVAEGVVLVRTGSAVRAGATTGSPTGATTGAEVPG